MIELKVRYDLASGAIDSWGESIIAAEGKGVLDEIDSGILEYLSLVGHVDPAQKRLIIDENKLNAIKNAPPPEMI